MYGNRLSIMSAKQAEEFSSTNECNFAISLPDTSRFRVNAMIQRGATALVFRAITSKIPKFESLNLPPVLKDVALKNAGWLFCRRHQLGQIDFACLAYRLPQ